MTLVQSDSLTAHASKKILVTLIENMCWNLFSSIIHILAALLLLNSGCRLLSTSFLIRPALFDKAAKKSFSSFLRADGSMDGRRSSAAKPSSMSVALTDSMFSCGLPTIGQWQFCC